jgi:UDP-N-acetylmuramoyl-L-alanyl-D-glutamate--2,6-diaminopimelate ligase
MGKVVTEMADYAFITDDNPRSEDSMKIVSDIKKGIKKKNFRVIRDRKKAILASIVCAKPGEVVLIAGKGHEPYQIIKNKILPFNDREVVEECLKSLKS